jgi:hypothetical protein
MLLTFEFMVFRCYACCLDRNEPREALSRSPDPSGGPPGVLQARGMAHTGDRQGPSRVHPRTELWLARVPAVPVDGNSERAVERMTSVSRPDDLTPRSSLRVRRGVAAQHPAHDLQGSDIQRWMKSVVRRQKWLLVSRHGRVAVGWRRVPSFTALGTASRSRPRVVRGEARIRRAPTRSRAIFRARSMVARPR